MKRDKCRSALLAILMAMILPISTWLGNVGVLAQNPTIITFEESGPPPLPLHNGDVVRFQYAAAFGVTFSGQIARDYSTSSVGAGFQHTAGGKMGIEQQCGELCTLPIEITFANPQNDVKVWVGYDGSLTSVSLVILRAYDAKSNLVGSTQAQFAASAQPIPIRTSLEVQAPNIQRVDITFNDPNEVTNNLAIDDLTFSAVPTTGVTTVTTGSTILTTQFTTTITPTCSLSANTKSGVTPLPVTFQGSITAGSPPYTYSWTFGDGNLEPDQSSSSTYSATHTYTTPGQYFVVLQISGAGGTGCNASVQISVTRPLGTLIPIVTILDPYNNELFPQPQFGGVSLHLSGKVTVDQRVKLNLLTGLSYTISYGPNFQSIVGPNSLTASGTSPGYSFDTDGINACCVYAGVNRVIVTATDDAGMTGQATVTVSVVNAEFRIMGIEVTQAIQDLKNDVPLIANKQTYVRVYLDTIPNVPGPGAPPINNVAGILVANRLGWQSHKEIQSLNTITVDSSNAVTPKRLNYPSGSLNFQLPPDWITAGPLYLGLSRLYIGGHASNLVCNVCALSGVPYTFSDAPPVFLAIVKVDYTLNGVKYSSTQSDVDQLVSFIERAYPTSEVAYYQFTIDLGVVDAKTLSGDCGYVDSLLQTLKGANNLLDVRTHFYGVASSAGAFMRGCSPVPGKVGSGPAGQENFLCGNNGDCYAGHEIGHEYGRQHAGAFGDCDGTPAGPYDNYPYSGGLISGPDTAYVGFDVGDPSLGIIQQVYDPSKWADIMTYKCNEWISDYTYRAILAQLYKLDQLQDPPDANDTLLVSGIIDLISGKVQLQPMWHLPNLRLTTLPSNSSYSIDFLDSTGKTLASYPFAPSQLSDTPPDQQLASFYEVVRYAPGTSQVAISRGGVKLATRSISGYTPQVKVLYPTSGLALQSGMLTVTWQTSYQGGNLTYALLYSSDGGKTWQAIDAGIHATQYTLDLDALPGSNTALLRVAASDGLNTGYGDSGLFTLSWKAPKPRIISPGDGSRYSFNQTIVFVGQAFDNQDGWLEGQALKWSSDQGIIGYGRMASVTGLSPGNHTITLTATDSRAVQGIASITIQIASSPFFNATIAVKSTTSTTIQVTSASSYISITSPIATTSGATTPGAPKCLIATATYGSELAPEVQLLRGFRDNSIMKTNAGSNFMIAFNAWYYSFSPYVASYIANHSAERTVMKGVLYPLIGTLYLTSNLYGAVSAYPELASLVSGVLASSLIGVFYLGLPLSLLRAKIGRMRGLRPQILLERVLGLSLLCGTAALLMGEIISSPLLLMVSSVAIVLSTLFLSAAFTSATIAKRLLI